MQGRFDGMAVEVNEGKFGGSFDIPEEEGEQISYDTTFVFVVTGIAGRSTFDTTKAGDVKRLTQFDLHDVVVLSAEDAEAILAQVRGRSTISDPSQIPGQLSHDDYDEDANLIVDDEEDFDDNEVFSPDRGSRVGQVRQTSDSTLASFLDAGV